MAVDKKEQESGKRERAVSAGVGADNPSYGHSL